MARMKRINTLSFERWQQLLCADDFMKEGVPVPPPTPEEGVLLCEEVVRLRSQLRRTRGELLVILETVLSKPEIDGTFPQSQFPLHKARSA